MTIKTRILELIRELNNEEKLWIIYDFIKSIGK